MLFLDEGTANLDVKTERDIVDVIAGLSITRVVVAHRPAMIEVADTVCTIDGGHARVAVSQLKGRDVDTPLG